MLCFNKKNHLKCQLLLKQNIYLISNYSKPQQSNCHLQKNNLIISVSAEVIFLFILTVKTKLSIEPFNFLKYVYNVHEINNIVCMITMRY